MKAVARLLQERQKVTDDSAVRACVNHDKNCDNSSKVVLVDERIRLSISLELSLMHRWV
jgi:hypothetical protein